MLCAFAHNPYYLYITCVHKSYRRNIRRMIIMIHRNSEVMMIVMVTTTLNDWIMYTMYTDQDGSTFSATARRRSCSQASSVLALSPVLASHLGRSQLREKNSAPLILRWGQVGDWHRHYITLDNLIGRGLPTICNSLSITVSTPPKKRTWNLKNHHFEPKKHLPNLIFLVPAISFRGPAPL